MFQFCTTRNGVVAKKIEHDLGVNYKTAWRMCHMIREYMGQVDENGPVGGIGRHVEIDETLIGSSVQGKGSGYKGNKSTVVGMIERGGKVATKVVTSLHKEPMRALIKSTVLPGTTVSTDEFGSYREVGLRGYRRVTVNHSKGEYTGVGEASVNSLEVITHPLCQAGPSVIHPVHESRGSRRAYEARVGRVGAADAAP